MTYALNLDVSALCMMCNPSDLRLFLNSLADEQLLKQVPEKFIIPSRHLQTLKETIGQGIIMLKICRNLL